VIEISTPVTVHNPIDIDTSDKRLTLGGELLRKGAGFGFTEEKALGLNALAGYGNFLANTANAAGTIVTAGEGMIVPHLTVIV
jgi:hypothetical protein